MNFLTALFNINTLRNKVSNLQKSNSELTEYNAQLAAQVNELNDLVSVLSSQLSKNSTTKPTKEDTTAKRRGRPTQKTNKNSEK